MEKQTTFKVLANTNLATHFIDFGVLAQDSNCFELSSAGYENLQQLTSSPLESGITWYLEGAYQKLADVDVARRRAIALSRFPDDARSYLDTFLRDNFWAEQDPPCPIVQTKRRLIVKCSKYSWLEEVLSRLGYAPAEDIWSHMVALYPVTWGKIDAQCFDKGKIGEKYRGSEKNLSLPRVFVFEDTLWIALYRNKRREFVCSNVEDPSVREFFTRPVTFCFNFSD